MGFPYHLPRFASLPCSGRVGLVGVLFGGASLFRDLVPLKAEYFIVTGWSPTIRYPLFFVSFATSPFSRLTDRCSYFVVISVSHKVQFDFRRWSSLACPL